MLAALVQARDSGDLTAAAAAALVAGTAQLGAVAVSQDGAWVTYTVTRRSVEANELTTQRLLQRLPRAGEPAAEPVPLVLPAGASGVRWHPDGSCLSMILREPAQGGARFVCHDIKTGAITPFPVRGRPVTADYKWSPRGNRVAFTAALTRPAPLDPRRGVAYESIQPDNEPVMVLFVLDVRSGEVRQLTSGSMSVARGNNFDWSPDEGSLAVAINPVDTPMSFGDWGYNIDADLVVVDVATGRIRPLVTQPGADAQPCWSPDGRWIAFTTQHRFPAYRPGWPALVRAEGGPVVGFPQDETPMGLGSCHWSADAGDFRYVASVGMAQRFVRADVSSRTTTVLPQASQLHLAYEDNRSFSADGRLMVFTRESLTTPAELFFVALDARAQPAGAAVQLTNLSPDFSLDELVHTEEMSWPSTDGRFTIHGLLLTPASVRTQGHARAPLPTLLYNTGGPGMVLRGFARDGWSAYLPLAARGYAVLIPNTRGRGGYGAEFHDAIRTGRNRYRDPLADALAGLDLLIAEGIADPERTAMLGHSYGAGLTAYAITQTHRFRAAVSHEGFFYPSGATFGYPHDGWVRLLQRDYFGIHDPFDAAERARILEESPGLHVERVRTPTLLLSAGATGSPHGPYGAKFPNPVTDSGPFYDALRRFNVPAALLVYDESHVFQRPAAIADDLTRTGEWLDHWVRDLPFPDAAGAP